MQFHLAFIATQYYIDLVTKNYTPPICQPIHAKEAILQTAISQLKVLILTALLCVAGSAQAGITVYTNQAAYLAAVSATAVDTYDNLPIDTINTPLQRTAGVYSYTVTTSGSSSQLYGAGNGDDHWLGTNAPGDSIVFSNFSSTVRGVGGFFFGSDIFGDYTSSAGSTLTASNVLGEVLSYQLLLPTQSSFIGFISSDAIATLRFKNNDTDNSVWPTVNDLHLSAGAVIPAVPEPSGYAMLLAGMGLLGLIARRRQTRPRS